MAYTDREDLNYLGILYGIGKDQTQSGVFTPFLSALGGMQGGRAATSTNFQFPVAQPWSLASASQDTQSVATAAAAGTPTTTTRAQDKNTVQIMKNDRDVSYAKQSAIGEISGVTAQGGNQPVVDELTWQQGVGLQQIAVNIDYSFIQGTYVASTGAPAVNQTTRGIIEATATNAVAAGTSDLSKLLIDELVRTIAGNVAPNGNYVFMGNAFQVQQLNNIYGFAPDDRQVGGVNLNTIIMPILGRVGIMYEPHMPAGILQLVNMNVVKPMFVPHRMGNTGSTQIISWTPTAITAAKAGGFWYTQVGLDHGPEEYHGKITGLTTS